MEVMEIYATGWLAGWLRLTHDHEFLVDLLEHCHVGCGVTKECFQEMGGIVADSEEDDSADQSHPSGLGVDESRVPKGEATGHEAVASLLRSFLC